MRNWLTKAKLKSFVNGSAPEGAKYLPLPAILPTGGSQNIRDIDPRLWFSALSPVQPTAPEGTRPRQWQFNLGSNIVWTPGQEDSPTIGFPVLREVADSWDLLRLMIETRKDQVCRVPWQIRLTDDQTRSKREFEEANEADPRVRQLTTFFKSPDGVHPWALWLRMILEDMLVLDAPAIYCERDKSNKIASLRPIDGSTVKKLITDQGFTPPYPDAAYQQILYGLPALNLTTADLVYSPKNPRTWRHYGFSPTEQILVTIGIGLQRQRFQQNWYLEGNIPEAMCFMPADMPVSKVKEVQEWFDMLLTGNLAKRRRLLFVPGYGTGKDAKPNVIFPKEALLKDDMDEWLVKIVAFAFSISPQQLIKQMNRASAQSSAEIAEEEGIEPTLQWLTDVMNLIIQNPLYLGYSDLEFTWQPRKEVDLLKQAQVDKIYVDSGIRSRNEIRENLGDDPDESPEAGMLMVSTGSGVIPLSTDARVEQMTAIQAALPTLTQDGGSADDKKPQTVAAGKALVSEIQDLKIVAKQLLRNGRNGH